MAAIQRVKAPFYAYPTSDLATRMGRHFTGCYGVEIKDRHDFDKPDRVLTHGPFNTLESAEDFAAGLPYEWDTLYLHSPLYGSRFASRRRAVA